MKRLLSLMLMIFCLLLASCTIIDNSINEEKYNVSFDNCGLGESISDIKGVGRLPHNLPVLFQDGYQFLGWYLDIYYSFVATEGSVINSDTILYAKWAQLEITKGLVYELSDDESYYVLYGIEEQVKDVVIPTLYNGKVVKGVGEGAFMNDSVIETIMIPSSIEYIEAYAFSNSSSLKSISIGSGLKTVDKYAFCNVINLEKIVIDSHNPYLDSRENCNAIIESSTNIILVGCKTTMIPNTVSAIGRYAFYGCSELEYIMLPDSVSSILECAFHSCSKLEKIVLGSGLESVGDFAFVNCKGLKTIFNNSKLILHIGSNEYGSIASNATYIYSVGQWEFVEGIPMPKE